MTRRRIATTPRQQASGNQRLGAIPQGHESHRLSAHRMFECLGEPEADHFASWDRPDADAALTLV